jgi:uncharacterized membrane protein YGL010W
MNLINTFRKNILYGFLALPLILLSYEALMSLGVGSRAWAFLFVGQLVLVSVAVAIASYIFESFLNNPAGVIFLFIISIVFPIIYFIYG